MKALEYSLDNPVVAKGFEGFQAFAIEDEHTMTVQTCVSPVRDTCLTMIALEDVRIASDHLGLQHAAKWRLSKEVRQHGNWSVTGGG